MDILMEMAREMGRAIQADERYTSYVEARERNDADEALQALIGEFNLKRIAINSEASRDERDADKLSALNREMQHIYADIMKNENMTRYNQAKEAMDQLLSDINAVLTLCANGEDPDTAEPPHSCGGSCSTCSGCH